VTPSAFPVSVFRSSEPDLYQSEMPLASRNNTENDLGERTALQSNSTYGREADFPTQRFEARPQFGFTVEDAL
jgi:hypothetical protein